MSDAEFLVDGDLYVVDIVTIPDRLEHAVGKAHDQNVLYRLLAEVMIDPVDLMLVDDFEELGVQRFGGLEIRAKGLFDHQPPPRAAVFLQQADPAKCARDWREGARRRGEVEQAVAARVSRGFQFQKLLVQPLEGSRLAWIGLAPRGAFEEGGGHLVIAQA